MRSALTVSPGAKTNLIRFGLPVFEPRPEAVVGVLLPRATCRSGRGVHHAGPPGSRSGARVQSTKLAELEGLHGGYKLVTSMRAGGRGVGVGWGGGGGNSHLVVDPLDRVVAEAAAGRGAVVEDAVLAHETAAVGGPAHREGHALLAHIGQQRDRALLEAGTSASAKSSVRSILSLAGSS